MWVKYRNMYLLYNPLFFKPFWPEVKTSPKISTTTTVHLWKISTHHLSQTSFFFRISWTLPGTYQKISSHPLHWKTRSPPYARLVLQQIFTLESKDASSCFVFMPNIFLLTCAYLYKSFMTLLSFKKEEMVYKTRK